MKKLKKILAAALAGVLAAGAVNVSAAPVSNAAMTNEDITRLEPVDYDWTAQWIWDEDNTSAHNWICARKGFTIEDLSQVSDQVLAMVAVDSRYWLWINGEQVVREGGVKRGPTQDDTYMEYVDITQYLQEGRNVIAVQAWYFGDEDSYYSYNSSGQGGFLFEADLGNGEKICTDESWKVHSNDGYLISTEENNPDAQDNYRLAEGHILYDASAASELMTDGKESWMQPDYDDSAWEAAIVCGEAGDAPWNDLYERSIPQLYYSEKMEFENPEVYADYQEEYTTEEVTLKLELPGNIQMNPVLEIEADEAGLRIDIVSSGVQKSLRTSYIACEGEQEWESPGWMSAQYLTITVSAGIKIKGLYYYQSGYDAEQTGSFTCDDEDLNQLWQECYNSLYICMRDTFMDCPDRERAQWWGDVTSQLQEMFYSMDNSASLLYRKGVDTVIGWTETDESSEFYNVLKTVVPTNEETIEVPQQELYGIVGFWTYYLYMGEADFLEEIYEPAMNYLKLWNMGADGLVEHRAGTMDWSDWGKNQDSQVLENAWYYWALCSMEKAAGVLGITDDAEFFTERKTSLEENFDKTFWNGEAYYAETANELPDDRAQALAVLSGLAGEDKYEAILEILTETKNSSPYMENFVEQAMFQMGYEAEALTRMKEQYSEFLTDEWTTLGEFFSVNLAHMSAEDAEKYYSPTHNHAWSSGPMVALSGYAAGVYPTGAGYENWQVKPRLGTLTQVSCTVPTVIGDFGVEIEETDMGLNMTVVSPGNTGEIWVPVQEGQQVTAAEGSAEYLRSEEIGDSAYEVYQVTEAGTFIFTAE